MNKPTISNLNIFAEIDAELTKAREKFPNNRHMAHALIEEAGEVSQALIQQDLEPKKNKTHEDIFKECIQTAVMAIRLATEGDSTFPKYDPESGYLGKNWEGYKKSADTLN